MEIKKCKECGEKYECMDLEDEGPAIYCPDCIDKYYQWNVKTKTLNKREKPLEKNDLSYRKKLQPVTHRGKYKI